MTYPASSAAKYFDRIASFPVNTNLPGEIDQKTVTSAEIITVSPDGTLLAYSDSPLGAVGLIDITDPINPRLPGIIKIDGEPTSVAFAKAAAHLAALFVNRACLWNEV